MFEYASIREISPFIPISLPNSEGVSSSAKTLETVCKHKQIKIGTNFQVIYINTKREIETYKGIIVRLKLSINKLFWKSYIKWKKKITDNFLIYVKEKTSRLSFFSIVDIVQINWNEQITLWLKKKHFLKYAKEENNSKVQPNHKTKQNNILKTQQKNSWMKQKS